MSTALQIFLACLGSIGVILYGWGQYRNGKSSAAQLAAQEANDTVTLLKTRTDTLEKQLAEQGKKLHDYEIQMAKLEEANKHKDALIEQYFKIITNRNPDLEKTLEEVAKFLKTLNEKIANAETVSVS